MYSVGMYSWGQNGYILWILIAITFAYPLCQEEEAEFADSEEQNCKVDFEPVSQIA
jgi:hypothetical protein